MINIVMGPPFCGKSYFIEHNFKDVKKIDLYDYQEGRYSVSQIWESYVELKDDIIKAIENKEDFVVEHTLLKAERRKYYVDEIRKVTDEPIRLYVVLAKDSKWKENAKLRNSELTDWKMNVFKETYEVPTLDEGFSEIIFVYEKEFKN